MKIKIIKKLFKKYKKNDIIKFWVIKTILLLFFLVIKYFILLFLNLLKIFFYEVFIFIFILYNVLKNKIIN